MVRWDKHRKPLPADVDEQQEVIELAAIKLDDIRLKALAAKKAHRDAVLLSSTDPSKIKLNYNHKRTAAIIQRRGFVPSTSCSRCSAGGGPWKHCVLMDGEMKGGCANCFFSFSSVVRSWPCDHATPERRYLASEIFLSWRSANSQTRLSKPAKTRKSSASPSLGCSDDKSLPVAFSRVFHHSTINPKQESPQNGIVLMGDLVLPYPDEEGFDSEYMGKLWSMIHAIQQLDSRDITEIPKSIIDMKESFESFKIEEKLACDMEQRKPMDENFVHPSGSLKSLLAHRLTQPSLTSLHALKTESETADLSNPCTAMVMCNAFRPGETLMYDHLHRRSANSKSLEEYSAERLASHENFTYRLMESSEAKVEIIYGLPVQNRILRDPKMHISLLPLWKSYTGVVLGLLHEDSPCLSFHDGNHVLRKILVFATHPQSLFYKSKGHQVLLRQDLATRAAVLMADPTLEFDPRYYQDKKWVAKTPSLYEVAKLIARVKELHENDQNLQAASTLETGFSQDADTEETEEMEEGFWDLFFNKKPHSDAVNRLLLSKTIGLIRETASEECNLPWELPEVGQEWLRGQKHTMFAFCPVNGIENFRSALANCPGEDINIRQIQNLRFKDLLLRLMLEQQNQLRAVPTGRYDDMMYTSLTGQPVNCTCPCGSHQSRDSFPRYSCNQPFHYVTRKVYCQSIRCNPHLVRRGGNKNLLPVSKNIRYISYSEHSLRATKTSQKSPLSRVLLPSITSTDLPNCVEMWCIRCKEKTKIHNGDSTFFDRNPQWTIGQPRSLYLEKGPKCFTCLSETGEWSRFIPKNSDIPSIVRTSLCTFANTFQGYSRPTLAHLLGIWPASARKGKIDYRQTTKALKVPQENGRGKLHADEFRSKILSEEGIERALIKSRRSPTALLFNDTFLTLPPEFRKSKVVHISAQLLPEGETHAHQYWKDETGFPDPARRLVLQCRGTNLQDLEIVRWLEVPTQSDRKLLFRLNMLVDRLEGVSYHEMSRTERRCFLYYRYEGDGKNRKEKVRYSFTSPTE